VRAEDIEHEAAQWIAECDAGTLSVKREAALQAWLAKSDRHRAAFVRLQSGWREADRILQLPVPSATLDLDLLSSKGRRTVRVLAGWLAVAVSVLVAGGIFVGVQTFWGAAQRYSTLHGGFARIPLADGSLITLNTASEVSVHLTDRQREVTLLQGEAQFTVAHDALRAFDVRVGNQIFRAVDTVFSVRRLSADDVQVVVVTGHVAVVPRAVTLSQNKLDELPTWAPMVDAGQAAKIEAGGSVKVRELGAEVAHELSWTEGRLWLDGMALRDAVEEFNRYNRRQFAIGDPRIADLHVGGVFDVQDVESFAAALRSFGVEIDESDPGIIKLSKAEP
jgi:transmembrane sensor